MGHLTKYKPIFVIITGGLMYYSYTLMEKRNANKTTKIIFWISAFLSILILYYPNIIRLLSK